MISDLIYGYRNHPSAASWAGSVLREAIGLAIACRRSEMPLAQPTPDEIWSVLYKSGLLADVQTPEFAMEMDDLRLRALYVAQVMSATMTKVSYELAERLGFEPFDPRPEQEGEDLFPRPPRYGHA